VSSRRASSGDAALVIAMTLALAAGAPIEVDTSGPVICSGRQLIRDHTETTPDAIRQHERPRRRPNHAGFRSP
jgi:hypothetical protein